MKKLTQSQANEKMLEVLEDTKDFYSKDPSKRGLDGEKSCVFIEEESGNKCAVGRYLAPTALKKLIESGELNGGVDEAREVSSKTSLINILPQEFWCNLQRFHDINAYWNEKGLTRKGRLEYSLIKSTIKNNKYKV